MQTPKITENIRRVRNDKAKLGKETRREKVSCDRRNRPQTAAVRDGGELQYGQPGGVSGAILLGIGCGGGGGFMGCLGAPFLL